MRHALVAAVAITLLPSLAAAGPITAGFHLGVAQTEYEYESGIEGRRALGVFGRLGLTRRLSGQLELSRLDTQDTGVELRKATALLVVDLGTRGRLVPTLSAGIGVDQGDEPYGITSTARHIEGGFGLEYRAAGGLTLGLDLRLGGRSMDGDHYETQALDDGCPVASEGDTCGSTSIYAPVTLRAGEYRAARITLGLRF